MAGRRTVLVLALLDVCALATMVLIVYPRDRLLLARAAQLRVPQGFACYAWRTNQQLIVCYNKSTRPNVVQVNTRTGETDPLKALNTRLKGGSWKQSWMMSPDGRWLFCNGAYPSPSWHHLFALDGSWVLRWIKQTRYDHWMPDARHLLTSTRDRAGPVVLVCDVASGKETMLHIRDMPQGWIVGGTDSDTFLVADRDEGPDSLLHLTRFSIRQAARLDRSSVTIPPDSDIEETVLSPHGERIAWLLFVRTHKLPAMFTMNARLFEKWDQTGDHWEVAVCQVNGRGMREIGRVGWSETDNAAPYALRWSPDGKRLSFCYKDALYTVPAE